MVPHGMLPIHALDLHRVGSWFRQSQEEEGIGRLGEGRQPRLVVIGGGGQQRQSGVKEEEQGPPWQGGSLGGLGANIGWFKVQLNLSLGCQDMGRWTAVIIFLLIFAVITL
jgi:hypothetical protein